jgi:hypothetical protein
MWFYLAIIPIIASIFIPSNATSVSLCVLGILTLVYVVYINIQQTLNMQKARNNVVNDQMLSQLNMNIMYSYFFTFSLGLLILFAMRRIIFASSSTP